MNKTVFKELVHRHLGGHLDASERAELSTLLSDPAYAGLLDEIMDEQLQNGMVEYSDYPEVTSRLKECLLKKTLELPTSGTPVRTVRYRYKWFWAAACLVLILGAALYIRNANERDVASAIKSVKPANESNVLPGVSGAVLTLSDGKNVLLDTIDNRVIALQGGATVRVANGMLLYEGKGSETLYNTMTTPKGRHFIITLPDGSRVWMNSASSIRYPTVFSGRDRRVEVSGEVYFEVRKGTIPFIVKAGQRTEVAVLGTQFNINSYSNEKSINVTLVDGAVMVNTSGVSESAIASLILKPGQQAQVLNAGPQRENGDGAAIQLVNHANIEQVTAWKNGLFNFDNAKLDEVMRQLERWYDVEVVYENEVPNIELMGKLSKGVTLNELTAVLNDLGANVRLTGRQLIVSSGKRY